MALIQHQRFRRARLASLRWLVLASVPVGLQAHARVLPDSLLRLALLCMGFCLAGAVAFAALEIVWSGRVAGLPRETFEVVIFPLRSGWDTLRSALWTVAGILSLVPWITGWTGGVLPASLLLRLTLLDGALLALALVAEVVIRLPPGLNPRRADDTPHPAP